jgi:Spy/CpxP family protein refolding chaperone
MVIFGAGVLTGALVVQFSASRYGFQQQPNGVVSRSPESRSPGGMRLDFLRRMQLNLDLTAEQREQVDKILKQSQERTRKIMEPVAPLLHQELQRAKAEFRAALTPAQQERFDDLLKQQQQRMKERRPASKPEMLPTNSAATNSI